MNDARDHDAIEGWTITAPVRRPGEGARSEPPSQPCARIERFELGPRLGTGGMGTVYEAWDEQLQRRVALKILRRRPAESTSKRRLLREAQGLARLAHPNVIPVYDVGHHEGRVWIAMEYVAGQTLREWVACGARSQAEILERWIAAGRGLAAIHAAGLIHRDIKPDNVLLGEDGRVRVIDLGLVKIARTLDERTDASRGDSTMAIEGGSSDEVTDCDAFLGTPAYSAPEQREERWVDARSDQYAFCVSLWEGLTGVRPHRVERQRGGLVPLPAGKHLPARLHRALSRGLSPEPDARFEDMERLLAVLEPARRRWLAPTVVGIAAAALVSVVNLIVLDKGPGVDEPQPCAHAAAPIETTWTEARRRALLRQLGPRAGNQAVEIVDDWSARWARAARESCEGVHIRHRRSTQALDRQSLCLDRRLSELEAVMGAVERGELGSLGERLATLDEPRRCLGEIALSVEYAGESKDEDQRRKIAAIRRELDTARVGPGPLLTRIDAAERALVRARELESEPLVAEASLALGVLHYRARNIDEARAKLGLSLDIGTAARDREISAQAWATLGSIARTVDSDLAGARWAWQRQVALFEGIEMPPLQQARLLLERGRNLELAAELEQAGSSIQEAIALYESLGPEHAWEHAAALRALGNLQSTRSRGEDALANFEAARRLELSFARPPAQRAPSDEPVKRLNGAVARIEAGDYAGARAELERGLTLAIFERGPRSELVARYHMALAAAHDNLGNREAFRLNTELADAISRVAVGPEHVFRADVLSAVGALALQDERPEAARGAFAEVLRIFRRYKPEDSLEVALAERNLGEALYVLNQYESARPVLEHAIEVLERELPPDHSSLIYPLKTLGAIRMSQGELDAGRDMMLRSRTLLEAKHPDSELIDEINTALVRWR